MEKKSLVDTYQRRLRKLRVSLTDKCNLRCHYCMPVDATFMEESKYLSPDEYYNIVEELCDYGLEEIRLTGGEPLLRKSFSEIVTKLSSLPLKKIGMTTNAILLDRYLDVLKDSKVRSLNISLDSLDADNFRKITIGKNFGKVIDNIDLAIKNGFHVKVNVVAMKGINDHELMDFVDYSADRGIEIRFLEVMRIGHALSEQNKQFISAREMTRELETKYSLEKVGQEIDSTSYNFKLNNGAQIGFIASESEPFCGHCSRWRLSADGQLLACLLKTDGLSIRNKTKLERESIYGQLLGMKPYLRPAEVTHQMNGIGG